MKPLPLDYCNRRTGIRPVLAIAILLVLIYVALAVWSALAFP